MVSPEPVEGANHEGRAAGPSPGRLALVVLLPFAGTFFMSYLFRAVNAVAAPDLVRDLSLASTTLGVLTAAYLLAFALFQPVLGLLLDRYGPRRTQFCVVSVAALGALVFAAGTNLAVLTLGRALIGIGFSGGLMASFKAVALWFPTARVPLANYAIFAVGGLGVVASTLPAELAIVALGWRWLFVILAGMALAAALAILFVVPEKPAPPVQAPLKRQIGEMLGVYRDRVFWRFAPLVCASVGAHIAIQTLWAGTWLRDVGGLDRTEAAAILLWMALAFTLGSVMQGIASDLLIRRGRSALAVMNVTLVLYFLCQGWLALGPNAGSIAAWLVFGATGSVAVLAWPELSAHFGVALAGRAYTAMNLLMFSSSFAIQSAIGVTLDFAPGQDGYALALVVLLALQLAAFAWYLSPLSRRRPEYENLSP